MHTHIIMWCVCIFFICFFVYFSVSSFNTYICTYKHTYVHCICVFACLHIHTYICMYMCLPVFKVCVRLTSRQRGQKAASLQTADKICLFMCRVRVFVAKTVNNLDLALKFSLQYVGFIPFFLFVGSFSAHEHSPSTAYAKISIFQSLSTLAFSFWTCSLYCPVMLCSHALFDFTWLVALPLCICLTYLLGNFISIICWCVLICTLFLPGFFSQEFCYARLLWVCDNL